MAVTDRGTAYDGFYALYDGTGNRDKWVPQRLLMKAVIPHELVVMYQNAQANENRLTMCKGLPLGRMPELPHECALLKRPLIECAEESLRQMALQGYELLGDITQVEVWGPYMIKTPASPMEFTPEADNPFIPTAEKKQAWNTKIWGVNEVVEQEYDQFLLKGTFIRSAKHGHVEEETGKIIV